MPVKSVKYGDKWYHWNPVKNQVEQLTIVAQPLSVRDVPREVYQELLKISDGQIVGEE